MKRALINCIVLVGAFSLAGTRFPGQMFRPFGYHRPQASFAWGIV